MYVKIVELLVCIRGLACIYMYRNIFCKNGEYLGKSNINPGFNQLCSMLNDTISAKVHVSVIKSIE